MFAGILGSSATFFNGLHIKARMSVYFKGLF